MGPWLLAGVAVSSDARKAHAEIDAATSHNVLYSPFYLHIDPMERLLLINFVKGADEVYAGFEPQVFDDDVHGTGLLVIGWRLDGYVDVYHQPGLKLDPSTYSIAGKGLADMIERPMRGARFEVTRAGVDASISFLDKLNRRVDLQVVERSARPRRPFSLLAPMGSAADAPNALPLVFLHGFYFVRQADSEIRVEVAGSARRISRLPIPLDGSRMYFLRYSDDPLITTWNPARDGRLRPLDRKGGEAELDGVTYDLVENDGQLGFRRMRRTYKSHLVAVDFSPPVPNLLHVHPGMHVSGDFAVTAGDAAGSVTGRYQLERQGDKAVLQVSPSGGWRPNESKWSLKFMYRLVPAFTRWPKTYVWTAEVDVSDPKRVTMRSSWRRTEGR